MPTVIKKIPKKVCKDCGAPGKQTPSGWACANGHGGDDLAVDAGHIPKTVIATAIALSDPRRAAVQGTVIRIANNAGKPTGGKSKEFGVEIAAAVKRADTIPDSLSEQEQSLLTASKIQLPQEYLSVSQIDMFLRCPYQFYQRYILGKKSPPGVALVEGRSNHVALQANNEHKIATGKDLPAKTMVEAFGDDWAKAKKEVEDWEGDKPDDVFARGKRMLTSYASIFAPRFFPELAESTFCVPVGPIKMLGVKDALGTVAAMQAASAKLRSTLPPTIVDYKTVGQAKSEKDVDNSLQLSGYAYDHYKNTGLWKVNVGLCSLVKKNGNVVWVSKPATVQRILWFRQVVLSVANAISLGNFPLTSPDGWHCSARFCGYHASCRGSMASTLPKVALTVGGKARA